MRPDGWIYFQGADNTLWKVRTTPEHDWAVTTRNEVLPTGPGPVPSKGLFDLICEAPSSEVVSAITATGKLKGIKGKGPYKTTHNNDGLATRRNAPTI